jgi:cation diffusion facilitator family transporter
MATGSTAAGARICSGGAFLGARHDRNERRTWIVVGVTFVMMLGEIIGGTIFGSIALVADGWHMASHAGALTIAAMAYRYARVHADDPRFAFGTGKVGELAGFASAVVLGVIALLIGWESLMRFFNPREIHFEQAVGIAVLGLVVNLASAWLLHQGDDHHHGHSHGHDHDDHDDHDHDDHDHRHHHDNNIRAAYMHVLADALTSVLAIGGLLAGWFLGWTWMDPVIGIVGAIVIAHWSIGLIRTAGGSLLDISGGSKMLDKVRARLETGEDKVCDVHLWRLAPGHQALMVSIETPTPLAPEAYKARLAGLELSHVTIEVNPV